MVSALCLVIITDMKTSTARLANLIEVLNEKLNSTDSMSITNNTKIGLQEIQIAKLKEDIENLKEKTTVKFKASLLPSFSIGTYRKARDVPAED